MTKDITKDDELLESDSTSLLHQVLIKHMATNSRPLDPAHKALTTKELVALRNSKAGE